MKSRVLNVDKIEIDRFAKSENPSQGWIPALSEKEEEILIDHGTDFLIKVGSVKNMISEKFGEMDADEYARVVLAGLSLLKLNKNVEASLFDELNDKYGFEIKSLGELCDKYMIQQYERGNLHSAMNFAVIVGTPRHNVLDFAERASNGDLGMKVNILESFRERLTSYEQFDRADWTQSKIYQIKEEKINLDSMLQDAEFIGIILWKIFSRHHQAE